jgi:putative transposase
LSCRDVQEPLFERGIGQWCRRFGQDYANRLKRRRPQPADKWYLDEVFLTMNGTRHYLWRAVDQDDNVLDILVQNRRNKKAAKKLFKKLFKGLQYVPRVVITDTRKSYGATKREILPGVEHPRAAISTTAVRIRTGRRASENVAWRGLSQRGMLSAFCPRYDRGSTEP